MPTLTIPDSYKAGIRKLAELSPERLNIFRQALEKAVPKLKPIDFAAQLKPILITESSEDLTEIVDALISLASILGSQEQISVEEFSADVVEAIRRQLEDLPEPANSWEKFKENLISVLKCKPLRLAARASDILYEEANVFTSARIFSDIRTVFDSETSQPTGALIIHSFIEAHVFRRR